MRVRAQPKKWKKKPFSRIPLKVETVWRNTAPDHEFAAQR
jgi:hypothetical protein